MYKVTHNADLTRLTTFGITAGCGCLVEYESLEDLRLLAGEQPGLIQGEVFNLGGGSNVLFLDGWNAGTVLHCVGEDVSELAPEAISDTGEVFVGLRVQAGAKLDNLVDYSTHRGLWGLENLAAIPGCVGGAAVQNVGAYGAEFARCVTKVRAFDIDTRHPVELSVGQCEYGYRHSFFKTAAAARLAICEVEVRLSAKAAPRLGYSGIREALGDVTDDAATPALIAAAVREVRSAKLPDPAEVGSAGSYFKNPVVEAPYFRKVEDVWRAFCGRCGTAYVPVQHHTTDDGRVKLSAAWLIDKAGCKPFSVGGASLWPAQPLVIVNRDGHATAADILSLQNRVQDRVEEAFAIRLEPEVVRLSAAMR